jgi:Stage II sporulation protein E (SpoIIE)
MPSVAITRAGRRDRGLRVLTKEILRMREQSKILSRTKTGIGGLQWVSIWLGCGFLIGLLLLANSIRDYLFVARLVTIQQVRQQVGEHITSFERDVIENPPSDEQLLKALPAKLATGSSSPLWIVLRDSDGNEIARNGTEQRQVFTRDQENNYLQNRERLFAVIPSSSGEAVVEVFPLRIRGRRLSGVQDRGRPPLSVEVAMPLRLSDPSGLWPIRRNLIINSCAALALLLTVALTAAGLRAYTRGKQLEQQLELAREVQANLLPGNINVQTGAQVSVAYQPAEDVGGDFYDVFQTSKGTALVIGDVSGKGVPAALLVGVIQGAVRSGTWPQSQSSHEQETAALNHLLCERASQSRYATMFWSCGDVEAGTLNYVNAGHCSPILVAIRDGRPEIKRLDAGGTVLGLLPEAVYRQGQLPIRSGDLIVLYSEGLVEAMNSAGEEFGESRLTALLTESIGESPENICDSIMGAIRNFLGRNSAQDDLTCVVARFRTPVADEHSAFGAISAAAGTSEAT